jgi:hypothetical protein
MRHQLAVLALAAALSASAVTGADAQVSTPKAVAEAAKRLKQPLVLMQAADALGMWRGLGARESLDEIIRVEIEASGVIYEPALTGPWKERKIKKLVFGVDYDIPASRAAITETDAAGKDFTAIHVVREHMAWNEQLPGRGATPAMASAYMRVREIETLPHGFMRAVFEADPKTVKLSKQGGKTVVSAPVSGVIGKATLGKDFRPERIELPIDHPVLGKTVMAVTYTGYKDWDHYEVFFPSRMTYTLGGKPWIDLTVSKHAVGPYIVFPVPPNVRAVAGK